MYHERNDLGAQIGLQISLLADLLGGRLGAQDLESVEAISTLIPLAGGGSHGI